jgi:hypothetical protein
VHFLIVAVDMAGQAQSRKKAKVVNILSPTPTQVDVDPIFFSQISSPPQALIAPTPAAHSQSKTWKSNDTKEKDQYSRLSTLLHHFVPESPFVPRSYPVWVQHRAMMNAMEMDDMKKNIAIKQSRNTAAAKVVIKPVLDGKTYNDNRSAVLAHETIWASWSTPTDEHPEALWPDRTEFQYEGDDRAKSDVGRFLPLPRKPGNETVNWKSREQVQPYRPLDHVGMFKEDGTPDLEMRQGCDDLRWGGKIEDMVAILLGTELIAELE